VTGNFITHSILQWVTRIWYNRMTIQITGDTSTKRCHPTSIVTEAHSNVLSRLGYEVARFKLFLELKTLIMEGFVRCYYWEQLIICKHNITDRAEPWGTRVCLSPWTSSISVNTTRVVVFLLSTRVRPDRLPANPRCLMICVFT